MSTAAWSGPRLRVLSIPDYAGQNPYQRLLAQALRDEGVRLVRARPGRRQPFPILLAWLRAGRPHVVHLHWTHEYLKGRGDGPSRISRWRFLGQLRVLRRLGVRIVWTVHNLGGHDGSLGTVERDVHRRLVELVDAVICHCEAAREAAIRAYGVAGRDASRLHVVPHGSYAGAYPEGASREQARAGLDLAAGSRVLLFLGAVRGYKGTLDLVRAFARVDDPDVRLVIAGKARDPAIEATLREAAVADPPIRLRLGFVPDGEVAGLLRAADVAVLPFRDILTSGSAILAMTYGLPVVAPALGCLPETVPAEGGILYDPDAPDALGGAIRRALTADLGPMGAAAAARAAELAWGPIAARTAELYRGGPGRGAAAR